MTNYKKPEYVKKNSQHYRTKSLETLIACSKAKHSVCSPNVGLMYSWNSKGVSDSCEGHEPVVFQNVDDSNLTFLKDKHIIVIGDSIARKISYALARVLGTQPDLDFEILRHHDIEYPPAYLLKTRISFIWSPYMNTTVRWLQSKFPESSYADADVFITTFGLWDLLHRPSNVIENKRKLYTELISLRSRSGVPQIVAISPTQTVTSSLSMKAQEQDDFTGKKYSKFERLSRPIVEMFARQVEQDNKVYSFADVIISGREFSSSSEVAPFSKDGVHYEAFFYDTLVQVLLNRVRMLGFSISKNTAEKEPSDLSTRFSNDALKGISHNPKLGALVLVSFAVMLLITDNFIGGAHLAYWINGQSSPSWNDIYAKLHKTLFS